MNKGKQSADRAGAGTAAGDLLDVNVWLALAVEEHVHHRAAVTYWNAEAPPRYFCRHSAMSLVRLLTQPTLMSGAPLALVAAWTLYERFANLPGVELLHEPQGVDVELAALIRPKLPSRLFIDAYFAALARSAGLRLVTFDRDFARFKSLQVKRLEAELQD